MLSKLKRRIKNKLRREVANLLYMVLSFRGIELIVNNKISNFSKFDYKNKKLNYFFHSYNNFGWSERVIEVPIVRFYLEQTKFSNILEIGNVSNHYYDYFRSILDNKTVVDKFEKAHDIVNLDIADFTADKKFDFIFSLSTFEHMDSDLGRNPDYKKGKSKYISYAYDNIKYTYDNLLDKNGILLITAPLLYASEWDETFYADYSEFSNIKVNKYVFKRLDENNWVEVNVNDCKNMPQNPYEDYREYLSVLEILKLDDTKKKI